MRKSDRWGEIKPQIRDANRPFEYQLPTHIVFGEGCTADLASYMRQLKATSILIVTDTGVRAAGIVEGMEETLRASQLPYNIYDAVSSDPLISTVLAVVGIIREENHDCVVGVGGGSSLDVAKAAAALVTNPGSPSDYVGRDKITEQPIPCIAIPTTAGTGSEVTIWSVLTDDQSQAKVSIGSYLMMPDFALLDPELTMRLPPQITAATGMDALSHAVESYGSVWNHSIAEPLALRAIELVGKYLVRAVQDGTDLEARRGMLLASLISELAANSTRLGLCHALAIPIGAVYHVPHGLANAILLDVVVDFNSSAAPDRYEDVARHLNWGANAANGIASLKDAIGITNRLSEWKVTKLEEIAAMATKSDNVEANPRVATHEQMIQVMQAAM